MKVVRMPGAFHAFGLALLILCLPAPNATAQSVQPSVPSAVALIKMVRMTMVAVHHANITGNYSVLRDLGTPSFAKANNAARLADIFRRWRRPDRNLDPVMVLKPVWLVNPIVDRRGVLSLKGYFRTTPLRVRFIMRFKPIAGRWRLEAISLKTFKPGKQPKGGKPRR